MALPVFLAICYLAAAAAEAPCQQLNDGYKIPIVALGTGRGTAEGVPNDEVRDAVLWAIEAGYRHIDTAAVYGDEVEVGQGVQDAVDKGLVTREQVFVTTKLWSDKHKREQVVPALRESLSKLGMSYVDLYLIHFPVATKADGSADDIDYLETWAGMEEAKQLGLARSIGVSNFNVSQVDRLLQHSRIPPAVNEVEVNPTLTQEPLVQHCQSRGIAVMAYSPFGFLVSRNMKNAPPPRYDDPKLLGMAQKYNKTTGQIVLRYSSGRGHQSGSTFVTSLTARFHSSLTAALLAHSCKGPSITALIPYKIQRGLIPIPKSTNKARLAQNIDLFDFELTPEEMATISAFNKNVRVIDGKWFEGFPYYPFESIEQ